VITLVLDTSVALKWAFPMANETLTNEALRLFQRYRDGEVRFVVPDVFWAEIANVLRTGERQRRWTRLDAEILTEDFAGCDFTTVPSLELLSEAMAIAFSHDRNLFECLYAALAVQARANWITADEGLADALAARFPVKWLGAF
jgi:predicted nucleic acid-binding protein